MAIDDLAIVLTGTIVPNAPFTAHNDPQVRRREYLEALCYYRQFAPVYFLENSIYPLGDDAELNGLSGVTIRQRPTSGRPERGKGYQEFEMIDGWLLNEPRPPQRWIKITGRYLYRNAGALLADCRDEKNAGMIIDRCARFQSARTCLFYVATEFYLKNIAGIYQHCNDESGEWIERVLYRQLAPLSSIELRVFSTEPFLTAVSGTTGGDMKERVPRYWVKQALRRINYTLDRSRLWYARG